MAMLYRTDGTESEIIPANGKWFTLEELQRFVGGYIEIVPLDGMLLVMNEEGKLDRLPLNRKATLQWIAVYGETDVIVGDALIASKREVR